MLGLHQNVLESVSFVIDFFRSTPATAMIPAFLLWFGVGRRIIDFQSVYDIAGMYSMILVVGIIGYLLNLFFSVIEHQVVHWHRQG